MAQHDSKALANKFIHALETRDLDAVSDLLADDVVFEDVPLADTVHRGKPKAVEKVAEFFGKSSSYVWKKHRVVSENGTAPATSSLATRRSRCRWSSFLNSTTPAS